MLYCAEQLTDFLNACERDGHKRNQPRGRAGEGQAERKENRVSSGPGSGGDREAARPKSTSGSRKKDQVSLPFAPSR